MQQQQPSPPRATAAGGGGGVKEEDEDPFYDIVIPPEHLLPVLGDDDVVDGGCSYGGADAEEVEQRRRRMVVDEAPAGGDERLSMAYKGRAFVFDSVPPHKIETILMLMNGYDLAPQSTRPTPTPLVQPIVVPQDFDRTAAVSRYREKRKSMLKFDVKADYSIRREVASRYLHPRTNVLQFLLLQLILQWQLIARRRGKFVSSDKSSENLVAAATALWRQIECCANCGESSEATPMMRQGPNGYKTFCNACGLMWAKTGKIRKLADPEGGEAESRAGRRVHDGAAGLVKVERLD